MKEESRWEGEIGRMKMRKGWSKKGDGREKKNKEAWFEES